MKLRRLEGPACRAAAVRVLFGTSLLLLLAFAAPVTPTSETNQLGFLARTGNESAVAKAAAEQPDALNIVDSYGWTPLFWAVDAGNVGAARALLQAGADPYVKMAGSGWNALMWAAGMPQAHELIMLLVSEFGVDPNRSADNGFSALMAACKAGGGATVKALLDAGADVDAADEGGVTALMLAAASNEVAVVEELVMRGSKLNQLSNGGLSAASFAAEGRREDILQWLLGHGAYAEAENQLELATPLALAAKMGHASMMNSLLTAHRHSPGALVAALHVASARGHTACVEALLRDGANVDGFLSEGGSLRAVAVAAAGGHVEVVKILLKAGATPGAVLADPPGGTPLEVAARGSTPGCKTTRAMLINLVREKLSKSGPREGWGVAEVVDWLCVSPVESLMGKEDAAGGCRFASAFLKIGIDGRNTFGTQPALGENDLRDGWAVISWARAVGDNAHLALATSIATDAAFRQEQPQWFIRAGQANMKDLLESMAASGLQPWMYAGTNVSVLEAAKDSPELLAILEPAMRTHLAGKPTLNTWTQQDVIHWFLLEPGLREIAQVVKKEQMGDRAGAALASLLDPFCGTSAVQHEELTVQQPCHLGLPSDIELGMDTLLHWAIAKDLLAVAEWVVRDMLLRSEASAQKLWRGSEDGRASMGEMLVNASSHGFQAALELAVPLLVKQLRTTPLAEWRADYVRALAALTIPADVLGALRLGGCLSSAEALVGPQGGLISWPPLGHDVAQPSAQFHPDRLLSWACHQGCPALAKHIVDRAKNASATDHSSLLAWAALHKELPPMKQLRGADRSASRDSRPPLLLQCGSQLSDAAGQDDNASDLNREWQTVHETVAGIIAARVTSIPAAFWTTIDVVNWLLAAGRPQMADAVRVDGIDGAQISRFSIQPMQMFDPQSKTLSLPMGIPPAELLQWAVLEGKRATAAVILMEYCDIAKPAWGHGTSGGPSPLLVAQEYNLTEAEGKLEERVNARLAATPVANWTEIDVNNWLRTNELPHIAEPFKDDWIRGDALTLLLGASMAGSRVDVDEGRQLSGLAKLLHATTNDPRSNVILLEWALRHNHCNTIAESLKTLPTTEGRLLLEDRGGGQSLLDTSMWSRACGTSRRVILAVATTYLAEVPLSQWGGREVAAWLYRRDRVEWGVAFAEDGVTGTQLASWPGVRSGKSSPNMFEVDMGPESALQWALSNGNFAVARQVLRSEPAVMLGELRNGVTTLAALLSEKNRLASQAAEAESMVRQHLGELNDNEWTVADVANYLFISGYSEAYRIALSTRMNGAVFHAFVADKGMDAMFDSAAMASWAVTSGRSEMLLAVLQSGLEVLEEDFASELLLTASWNGDAQTCKILLAHGADVDWQNSNKYSALMRAALRGHGHVVSLLLDAGADTTLKSTRGKTAAELASGKGHVGIAGILQNPPSHGARRSGGKVNPSM